MVLLRASRISKSFGATAALADVSFELRAGEIAGLIGENGAGKSTLIRILSGVHQPDAGSLEWKDGAFSARTPRAALEQGIATIHQELACFEKLTVAENLMIGEPWPRLCWGGTDWRALESAARQRLSAWGVGLDPAALFHTASPAQRQEAAIARALSRNAQLLILDEPTAALSEPEVARLLERLDALRKTGVAILYVSHRLDEILKLTDRVFVLRDGSLVANYPTAEVSVDRLIRDMVGREITTLFQREPHEAGPEVFKAEDLSRSGLFSDISFCVRAGEVLGLSGLVGAGRSEIARAIYGLYAPETGKMTLAGRPYAPRDPAEARAAGVVYLPEERKRQGFVLEHPVKWGISIGFLESIARWGWISKRAETRRVTDSLSRYRIKARGPSQPVATLSGGNQQKALLARCLESDPALIILDEPTRGVDIGAKAEIHRLIDELAQRGKAVLLISSDLPEVLSLSDRILVLHRGRMAREFGAGTSQEKILAAASGIAISECATTLP